MSVRRSTCARVIHDWSHISRLTNIGYVVASCVPRQITRRLSDDFSAFKDPPSDGKSFSLSLTLPNILLSVYTMAPNDTRPPFHCNCPADNFKMALEARFHFPVAPSVLYISTKLALNFLSFFKFCFLLLVSLHYRNNYQRQFLRARMKNIFLDALRGRRNVDEKTKDKEKKKKITHPDIEHEFVIV
jgi:hypothetical protein